MSARELERELDRARELTFQSAVKNNGSGSVVVNSAVVFRGKGFGFL